MSTVEVSTAGVVPGAENGSADATDSERRNRAWLGPLKHWLETRVDARDLEHVISLLPLRETALKQACAELTAVHSGLNSDQLFSLAATDLFVEKAQLVLSRRAWRLFAAGVLAVLSSVGLLAAAVFIITRQLGNPIDPLVVQSPNALILRVFQAVALSAFILVGVKWLIALARNFFHEALSLLERRHALRYGRLYVYLRRGDVSDKGLKDFFQWNKETRTSFLDIKPEVLAETLLHKAVEGIGSLPPATLRALGDLRKKRNQKRAAKTDKSRANRE